MRFLDTPSGTIRLPAFFPDATYGAIRAGAFEDVYAAGLFGCEMNSYHLMTKPGAKLVKAAADLAARAGISKKEAYKRMLNHGGDDD